MHVVVAGAHGQVARRLGRLLSARGDSVAGIVRNPAHAADLEADGVEPVVLDLESAPVDEVAAAVQGADAAERARVLRYLLVSSMGVDAVADGAAPPDMDEVFVAYLRAKLAAEQELLARRDLATTVLRPGGLTDEPGTGRVTLAPRVDRGSVPRDDVAAVLLALLDHPADGAVLELVSGPTPIPDAVAAAG